MRWARALCAEVFGGFDDAASEISFQMWLMVTRAVSGRSRG